MNADTTPRAAALDTLDTPSLWPGTDERFAGYGLMGLPFASGDYLALRHFGASTIGPPYRAIWHRDPNGVWTFYATTSPERSCARYLAHDPADRTIESAIDVRWDGPYALTVEIPGVLDWRIRLTGSPATAMMSAIGRRMPVAAWRSDTVLRLMSRTARPMLRAGRIGLCGTVPNGQRFAAAPRLIWSVADSTAVLDGRDLGIPKRLPQQRRLGDFWLPQRGLFAVANAAFG